jgi:hypothetical protein
MDCMKVPRIWREKTEDQDEKTVEEEKGPE